MKVERTGKPGPKHPRPWWPLLLVLAGCGGGVGTDGTGDSPDSLSVGAVTEISGNSVTVNGVTFDHGAAAVTDGFGRPMSADDLRLGMWLEVTGRGQADPARATAQAIRVRPAVRGQVSSVDETGLAVSVMGTTARYTAGATVLDGVDNVAGLRQGDSVELHGALGESGGDIEASRVERIAPARPPQPVELRGRVSALDVAARSFVLGRQKLNYGQATLTLRKALDNGQVLRAAAAEGPASGVAWSVQRVTTDQALPDRLRFMYAEGLTTAWAAGPSFELEGLRVDASSANGRGSVVRNGQRVAVIGSLQGDDLTAESVAVVRPGQVVTFVLTDRVATYQSLAQFRLRDVLVDASTAELVGGTAAELVNGRRVRATGSVSGQKLVARKLEFL